MKISFKRIAISALTCICVGALSFPFVKIGGLASSAYKDHSVVGKDTLATSIRSVDDGYSVFAFDSQSSCLSFKGETPFSKVGGCAILEAKAKLAHQELSELLPVLMKNKQMAGFTRLHSENVIYTLPIYIDTGDYTYWNGAPVRLGVSSMTIDDINAYNNMKQQTAR